MGISQIGRAVAKNNEFQQAMKYMFKNGVTKTPPKVLSHCTVEYKKVGDAVHKVVTKENGTVLTGIFDSNGNNLGFQAKSTKGTYRLYKGEGYKLEQAHLNSEHPLSGLDRITTEERSAYAEARKFYNDHKEWHGIEQEYSNRLLDCRPQEIKTNTWARGKGIDEFTLQEVNPSYGCAMAQLKSSILGRYTSAPFSEWRKLDTTFNNMKLEILG